MSSGNTTSIAVIILAAGASSRMGGVKKEYLKLDDSPEGLTVLGSSVRTFAQVSSIDASVDVIVIAVPKNGEAAAGESMPPEYLAAQKPKIVFVEGGKTRRASVYNALSLLAAYSPDFVLIHDGARPWVSSSLIENIIKAVKKHGAVIPLLPFSDTPKECDAPLEQQAGKEAAPVFITRHLKRSYTGGAQTPQAFKFPEIWQAHKEAAKLADTDSQQEDFTDDAEVWGKFCGQVAVVIGEPENRKITYIEDVA